MNQRDFWEAGYRVFGLHGINKDKSCACGNRDCKAAGKHPISSGWQHTPLWSEDQLETGEEAGQFETGYGVLCRGLLVVDVDARNGGVQSYEKMLERFPMIASAGLIVETGSGNGSKHLYFSVPEDMALVQHLNDFKGIDFKTTGFVVGPGSTHVSGRKYVAVYGSPDDIDPAPIELIEALRKPERHRAVVDGTTIDVSQAEIADMLSYIDPDCAHEIWIRCGMAAHHSTGGTGFAVWDGWSSKGKKYPGSDDLSKRWHSFGKASNPVTLGTLVHYAESAGWQRSVTFEPNDFLDFVPDDEGEIDISNIDLTRPPGFVGEVAAWIHDQCSSYRENIAVGAALTVMGNLVGLKYQDEVKNTTTNLISFCVAGSATGKESILQGASQILETVKLERCSYGAIKSEQEIVRNLTDHQASFYLIDEIGYLLTKIKNAQAKGTASYLEGVIGIVMSIYSKANGKLMISGDVRKDIRKSLLQEIAQIEKQIDANGPDPKLEASRRSKENGLSRLDGGIPNPFLSILGFTTNTNFDATVDYENSTNGFIGRSLIFVENKTVPKDKKGHKKRPMPEAMRNALIQLYQAGSYDMMDYGRIENYGEKISIPTTDDGIAFLERVMDKLHEMAESHVEKSGLEALFLRARELVAKVSFILAVPSGVRTVEHIRWAYALVKRDTDYKVNLVIGNDKIKDEPKKAMLSRLDNLLAQRDGETLGVIVNKMRGFKREDIEKVLTELVARGLVILEETVHSKRKIIIKRYRKK